MTIGYKELYDESLSKFAGGYCKNCGGGRTEHFEKSIKTCEICQEKMARCPAPRHHCRSGKAYVCYNKNCKACFNGEESK